MTRSEIKNFTISYGKCGSFSAEAPCTLFSVLSERGIFVGAKNEEEKFFWQGYFDSPCEFSSEISLTPLDLQKKYIYMRLSGLDGIAEIYLNDNFLIKSYNPAETHTLDIKRYVRAGANRLSIKFLPEGRDSFGKAAHQSESEYGLSVPDAGIVGRVELLKFNNAVIDNLYISQRKEGESVVFSMRMETLGNADSVKAVATLVSGAGQVYYGGFNRGLGSIVVRQPLYWWPRGLGMQNLYKLTVNLYGETDIEDTKELTVGIGDIGLNPEKEGPPSVANGVGYMPLGMIYTPASDIMSAISDEKIEAMIISLAKANANTLVISGSGGFADERLLSACDRHGIVVWQELPYGKENSTLSPESYVKGVASSLRRLAHHPSLAVIVDSLRMDKSGELLTVIKNTAPALSFMSCDEYSRLPKLSYPAIPDDKTLNELAGRGANLFSEAVEWHGGESIQDMLTDGMREYLYAENLSDFGYMTRLLQARAAESYTYSRRLDRESGSAAIISRLADSRATISDAMLDYHCRPKALLSYAKDFFAPIVIIPKVDGGRVSFAISNERRQAFEGLIYYRILDAKNNIVYNGADDVSVPEMSVAGFEGRDFTDVIRGHENEYYLEYGLRDGAVSVTRKTLLFVAPKRFRFADPDIKAQISGSGRSHTITLRAEAFAKDVEVSFEGYDVVLSDNYIDITSQTPVKLNLTVTSGAVSSFELEDALHIRSVYNIENANKGLKKSRFAAKKEDILEKLHY